jgi:NAD+-processing family protein with receiver domain
VKVFLDDIRNPPDDSWIVVRNYSDCISLLQTGKVTVLSLDHDLGADETGYDVAKWIEEKVFLYSFNPPEITIHSANPVGRSNIEAALYSIYRQVETRDN